MSSATLVLIIIAALTVLAVSLAFVVCSRVAAQRRRERLAAQRRPQRCWTLSELAELREREGKNR